MRTFVGLSLRYRVVQHGMTVHNKEISSKTPLDMSETIIRTLLVQWVSAWCTDTRTAQQIVTSWEMVLQEVPIAESMDAMPEPLRVVLLVPAEQDAPAIPFNHHVIEATDEASNYEQEPEAPCCT